MEENKVTETQVVEGQENNSAKTYTRHRGFKESREEE